MKLERIVITGAFGTGKTTLMNALSNELGLPMISEVARSVADTMGVSKITDLKDKPKFGCYFQWAVLLEQIAAEYALKNVSFVSDRSTIDNLMYWTLYHSEHFPEKISEIFREVARCQASWYTLIIYTPQEFGIESDGFRATSQTLQNKEDQTIRGLLFGEYRLVDNPILTVSGSVEDRVNQVKGALNILNRRRQ